MIELGELESHWSEFEKRRIHVVVVSVEDRKDAKRTQTQFPHLVVVADTEHKLADAIEVLHLHSAPDGGDTATPTTVLIDGAGTVRWMFRPDRVPSRLSPAQVLAAVDRELQAD